MKKSKITPQEEMNILLHEKCVKDVITVMDNVFIEASDKRKNTIWNNKYINGFERVNCPFTDIESTRKDNGKVIRTNVCTKSPWYNNFCIQVGTFNIVDAMYEQNGVFDSVDFFAFVTETHVYFVSSKIIRNHFDEFDMKTSPSDIEKYILIPLNFIESNCTRKLHL